MAKKDATPKLKTPRKYIRYRPVVTFEWLAFAECRVIYVKIKGYLILAGTVSNGDAYFYAQYCNIDKKPNCTHEK